MEDLDLDIEERKPKKEFAVRIIYAVISIIGLVIFIFAIIYRIKEDLKKHTPLEWCVMEVLDEYKDEYRVSYTYEELYYTYDRYLEIQEFRYIIYVYHKVSDSSGIYLYKDTWICDILAYKGGTNKTEHKIDDIETFCRCTDKTIFEFDYTEDDFEWLCDKVSVAYLKSDSIALEDIVYAINSVITNEEKTIKDILNLTHWELLELTVDKGV